MHGMTWVTTLWRDMRSQPLRTFLTLAGVIWGTLAITLLLAFGAGLQKRQIQDFRGLGEHIVIVWPARTSRSYRGMPKGRDIRITVTDLMWLRRRASRIRYLSPEFRSRRLTRYRQQRVHASIVGTNVEYARMRNIYPARGRFLNRIDVLQRRRVCFLGNRIARSLFGNVDPIGQTLMIERFPFRVVGVMRAKTQNSTYGERDENCIFIPHTTYSALFAATSVDNFVFQPKDPRHSAAAIREMRTLLGPRVGFSPDDEEALFVWATTEIERFLHIFFLAFNGFLGLIGTLTLSVAGMGVAAIMFVVVEERTREIGIKMALGMRRRVILAQFLLESVTLVLLGGAIGMGLAALIVHGLPAERLREYVGVPEIHLWVSLTTVTILLVTGCVAGWQPARKAASVHPVEALRA